MGSSTIKFACIIDDDNIYVSLIKKIIKSKNLCDELIVFNNGKQSLDYFENISNENVPDVIFLDINMPVMDGWEFLEQFKKIKTRINKNIPIYMVSSSIDPADINRAKSLPVIHDYIPKPLNIKKLESIFA